MIEPPWIWPRAAYIHLPFCAHQCGYCDFAVAVGKDDQRAAYLKALAAELTRLQTPQPIDTLFFGGGTPTYLAASELEACVDSVLAWLPLKPGHEFSVEANPGTLDDEKLRILVDRGLTRLSLGAQSFDPDLLRVLERDHQPADVFRAMELARRYDISASIDLIFGVPGQTTEQWRRDLDLALSLNPEGVATYGLTYEKGTRLWKQRRDGGILALDEENERTLYDTAIDVLEAAGYVHCELSNFARPGKECRHNHVYWANEAHFGFGMGAAEFVRGVRNLNTRDFGTYIRRAETGRSPVFQTETLPPRESAFETIGQNLRRRMGIQRRRFREQTGFSVDDLASAAITRLVELNLLRDDGENLFLTREGKCVADNVALEFWKEC